MRGTWILIAVGALLLAAVIAGATWLSNREAPPPADLSIGEVELDADSPAPSTSVASVPERAAEAESGPAVRSEIEVADEALPPDVHWVSGRVLIPAGTPLDEHIRIVARGRKLAGRELHSAEVDGDGYFRVAFSAETKHGHFELESNYLYLGDGPRINVRKPPEDLELEPVLGGRVVGKLLLPNDETTPHEKLIGKKLMLWGSERDGANSWRSVQSKHVKLTADLEFDLGGLRPLPRFHMRLEAGPYRSLDRQGVTVQPGQTTEIELQLEPGATIAGRVVDTNGEPLDKASVEIEFDYQFGWSAPRETRTDEDGRFEFLGVDPQPLTVTATMKNTPAVKLEIEELLEREERTGIELMLTRGSSLAGSVTWPDGRPVADGWIQAQLQEEQDEDTFVWREGESRRARIADGAFELEGLTAGRWDLHAWAKFAATTTASEGELPLKERIRLKRERRQAPTWHARLKDVEPGNTQLALVLDQGHSLSGRVTDDRGRPIERFRITLTPTDEEHGTWRRRNETVGRKFEDSGGSFEFEAIEPDSYQLEAEAAGHAPLETNVTIPATKQLPLIMQRTATVSGRVTDRDGGPIEGAKVAAIKRRPGYGSGDEASDRVETGEDGRFELDDVHPGTIRVRAFAPGLTSTESDPLEVAPGGRHDGVLLSVGLGGRIVGRVLDATGGPKVETSLSLSDENTGEHHWTETDHEGRFAFDNLAAGNYVLQVNPSQEELASARDENGNVDGKIWRELALQRAVELMEGQTVELTLQPGNEAEFPIEGVVMASGEPVAKASISLRPAGRRLWSMTEHVVTDDEGRFEADLKTNGEWTAGVTVAAAGGLRHDFPFEIPTNGPLVFELPVGAITGSVVDVNGATVSGTRVSITMAGPGSQLSTGSAVTTDNQGNFQILHLSPGVYGLSAGAPVPWQDEQGQALGRGSVAGLELEAGQRLTGVEITVVDPGSVEGIVTTPEGLPVPDARVFVVGADGRAIDEYANHRTDESGRYTIPNVPAGSVRLHASAAPATTHSSVAVTVRSAAVARADLTVELGTTISIEPLIDGSRAEATIEARGPGGVDYALLGTRTWNNGLSRVGPVPPGTYTVTARGPGGETATETVSIGGDQLEVSVALELR